MANVMWFINGQIRLLTWCGSLESVFFWKATTYARHGESRFSVWRMGRRRETPKKLEIDSISNGNRDSPFRKVPG